MDPATCDRCGDYQSYCPADGVWYCADPECGEYEDHGACVQKEGGQ